MAISRKQKEELIQNIAEKIKNSKAIVFTDYRGLSVEEINEVRNKLREKGIEFKVIKNTLFKIAVKEAKADIDINELKDHPIAAAFGYEDEVEPAKVTYEFSKSHEALELIGGVLNGKTVGLDQIKTLALMPSREEMYAKIVGSLASPLRGLASVLQGNLRGLLSVLDQYQKTVNS